MKTGLSFEAFGAEVNVSARTLMNWQKHFPDFREAHEIGMSHARLVWEKMSMVLIARGGGNGSAAVHIFNLKNRFGYRDIPQDEPEAASGAEPARPVTLEEKLELLRIARGEKK